MGEAMRSATVLAKLEGGDRRSVGRAAEVVRDVLRDPTLLGALVQGLRHADPVVRMRAADALEKASRPRPQSLKPFKQELLRLAKESRQKELRWHLAQVVPRLPLTARERRAFFSTARDYLRDTSSVVRTFALQALADLAVVDPALRALARATIEASMADGTPAMRARGRKLLAGWSDGPTRHNTRSTSIA